MAELLSELEGNALLGREHSLTTDIVKRYYSTKQPQAAAGDAKAKLNLDHANEPLNRVQVQDAKLHEHEICKVEQELAEKRLHLQEWCKSLDRRDEELEQLSSAKENLQKNMDQLRELERKWEAIAKEKRVHVAALENQYKDKSSKLESLTKFGAEKAQAVQASIPKQQYKIEQTSRALEDEKRMFFKNSIGYLKEKEQLYDLTTPVGPIPCGVPIPIDKLQAYDEDFKDNELIKQNLELCKKHGIPKTEVVLRRSNFSYSVEIPTSDGEKLSITASGSHKSEALTKLIDQLQNALVNCLPK